MTEVHRVDEFRLDYFMIEFCSLSYCYLVLFSVLGYQLFRSRVDDLSSNEGHWWSELCVEFVILVVVEELFGLKNGSRFGA